MPTAPPPQQSRHRAPRGVPALAADQVVPYDYGARFDITGSPGAIRQDVINISPDGIFVAVAIGYGFEEERGRSASLDVLPRVPTQGAAASVPALMQPGDLTLGELPPAALIQGFRVNPRLEAMMFRTPPAGDGADGNLDARSRELSEESVAVEILEGDADERRATLFQQVQPPASLTFLFSMLDSSSGRELQDEPTHNLASLGKSSGERPFRQLAQPVTFLPRSTVRLQVVERTEGVRGSLFIVLYGYKVLGSTRCAEPLARDVAARIAARGEPANGPSDRVIPFDYATTFALTGRPGNLIEAEATVNVEGGFVATAIGYSLLIEELGVPMLWDNVDEFTNPPAPAVPPAINSDLTQIAAQRLQWLAALEQVRRGNTVNPMPAEPVINLASLPLRLLPPGALADGFRLRPDFVRVAFQNNGRLADAIPVSWLDRLFERLNRVEDLSFRYVIYDSGRGREVQNEPIHNIAGLGTATGDRPFKKFARPLVFLPRSTIRVRVEERFGRGTLFVVFHGYKVLKARGGVS